MRGYVYIADKKRVDSNYTTEIKEILSIYNGLDKVNVRKASSEDNSASLYTFTNEPQEVNYSYGPYEFGMSGNFLKKEEDVFTEYIQAKNKDIYVAKLGGIYTLALLYKGKFTAWNNVTRVEPIYWSENSERIVVGTRALLVHLIANNSRTPDYEMSNMISFLNNGFYADENTPFKNLKVLDINNNIVISENNIIIKEIDNFSSNLYTIKPNNETYDELTHTYLNSFSYLKRLDTTLTTGLTGGKDSRLIVAALDRLGIPFKAHTTGFTSTSDVIVAREIAEKLGIEHRCNEPSQGKEFITADIYARTVNAIKNTEGLLYSYENVAGSRVNFNAEKVTLGGQGGENLRGGYARQRQFEEIDKLEKFMLNGFMRYRELLNEKENEYRSFLQDFIDNNSKKLEANDILNNFYLKYRTGRWSASSVPYYTASYNFFAPMFENQLVKMAHSIESDSGSNDELIYNILQRIAPELIDIPFANDRWNFEKNHPYHKYDLFNWINKQPIQNKSVLSGFNWRKNLLQTSKKQLEDIIFAHESSPIYEIINKSRLRKLFESPPKNTAYYDTFLWSLYTLCVMVENKWYEETDKQSKILIRVPKQTTKVVPNILEEIKHIPNNFLKSNHKDLSLIKIDDITCLLTWELTEGQWMYFQLFDNPYAIPPSIDKYEGLTKVSGNKMKFIFEIEKIYPDDFELEIYFIQYGQKSRIRSQRKNYYINQNRFIVIYEVSLEPKAIQYKVALKILNMSQKGKIMINQMRVEYIT